MSPTLRLGINVTSATQLTDALPNELQKPVNNEADYIACEFCSRRYKKSSINKHRARCIKRHSGDGHSTNPELFPSNLKVGSPKASANSSPKAAEINVTSNNHSGSSPKFKGSLLIIEKGERFVNFCIFGGG